jgi:hypothetical protein
MAVIEHQLATLASAALACFRRDRVNPFQVLMYLSLGAPTGLALALPIDFGDCGARNFEDPLFSAADTEHQPRFSLRLRRSFFIFERASTRLRCNVLLAPSQVPLPSVLW